MIIVFFRLFDRKVQVLLFQEQTDKRLRLSAGSMLTLEY